MLHALSLRFPVENPNEVSDEENRKFNLNLFRKQTLKIAFDALYGISNENITLYQLIELIAYLHFDGKIDGEKASIFELEMCMNLICQFRNNKDLSRRTLSLVWIYFKAHAMKPAGVSIEVHIISVHDFDG